MTRLPLALVVLALAASMSEAFAPIHSNRVASTKATTLFARVPTLDNWKILKDGSIIGTVSGHSKLRDGELITTSPVRYPTQARRDAMVRTKSGSPYKLAKPAAAVSADGGGAILVREQGRSNE